MTLGQLLGRPDLEYRRPDPQRIEREKREQRRAQAERILDRLFKVMWADSARDTHRPRIIRKYQAQILTLVGADGPCYLVDPDLWQLFSDCYKDDHGIRPRGDYTTTHCSDWLADRAREQGFNKANS